MMMPVFARRSVLVLTCCAVLAGCSGGNPLARLLPSGGAAPVTTLSLLGGAAELTAPKGYCIDSRSSRAQQGFALMARCARLGRSGAETPAVDALLSVQLGAAGAPVQVAAMQQHLSTEAGRAQLSQRGQASDVTGLEASARGDAVLLRFTDAGASPAAPQWRAVTQVKTRLAVAALRPIKGVQIPPASVPDLLAKTLAGLRVTQTAPAAAPRKRFSFANLLR